MVPHDIRHGHKLWTLLTSIFLHGGVVHLLGNAYFLYTLGDNTAAAIGSRRFAQLFILSGLAGAVAQALLPGNPFVPVVGASGAIAGVLGAYVVLFPRVRLYQVLFFVRFRIPVLWYGVGWVGFNVAMALSHRPHVAWMAHLGGFIMGVLLAYPASTKTLEERLRLTTRSQ
jgi:membrane associated rhomboid family serine protease